MPDFLFLADARILLALNHALASNASLYAAGLFLAGRISIVLMLLTAAYLWFWPQSKEGDIIAPVTLPGTPAAEAGGPLRRRNSAALRAAMQPFVRKLNRRQSRGQVLLLVLCLLLTWMLNWLLSDLFDVERPFISFLDIRSFFDPFAGLRMTASFPGEHAALLGAFVSAMFYWNRRLAWAWLALTIVFCLASVAVGYYHPSDALIGGFAGAGLTYKLFTFYRREGRLYDALDATAKGFYSYNTPYHYFLYFFLLLFGYEMLCYFGHIAQVLENVKFDIMRRF